MKTTLLSLFLIFHFFSFSQEMEDDLFATLNSSSMHIFRNSEKSKMTIKTLRNSKKNGVVEETTSNYRKGKINPNKINFNIHYTEFYVLEDRKKSLGKYVYNEKNQVIRYERTDFDNRNQRRVTFYHYYIYLNSIVERENIRIKEYIGQGSAELDTVVYRDSILYEISEVTEKRRQENLSDPGVYTLYTMENGQLTNKMVYFEGYNESETYTYDSKNHLVKIENSLTGDGGNSIRTRTELHYSIDGLITETIFYNGENQMLEKKIFTYK